MYTIFNQLKEKYIYNKEILSGHFYVFPKIYLSLFQQNRHQTFTHYQIRHNI